MSENRKCWYCGSEPIVWHDDVNLFAECPNEDCPNYGDNGFEALVLSVWNTRPIEDALQKRIDELESQLRWIPVSERLPEEQECYEVKLDRVRYGQRYEYLWYYESGWDWVSKQSDVTHWRPLPETPEVQQ